MTQRKNAWTQEFIDEIHRRYHEHKEHQKAIGLRLGVSHSTVSRVLNNTEPSHKKVHVGGDPKSLLAKSWVRGAV